VTGLLELRADRPDQPLVARQAQHVLDAVSLAPSHDGFPREAGVGADPDLHLRPARPDLLHDPGEILDGAGRAVDVAAAQLGAEQKRATEDVEREVAVVPVVAVEEPAFLLAVERIVRRVEVEHDPERRLLMSVQEVLDEQPLDGFAIVDDLVIARDLGSRALQAIERTAPGQSVAAIARPHPSVPHQIPLPGRHGQQRIVPQGVVIVEILVALGLGQHALTQKLFHRVLDPIRMTIVPEARREATDQPGPLRHLAQQQQAAVLRLPSAIKGGQHLPPAQGLKLQLCRTTV